MGNRRALLIGVEKYGDDLKPLPSATTDVGLIQEALEFCGYEIEPRLDPDADAATISDALQRFCRRCDHGDTHILYFSGHGTSVDGRDYLVPPGVTLEKARSYARDRIDPDLAQYARKGLVVFVIDACRDRPLPKGPAAEPVEAKATRSFVQFFGCEPGKVCQVGAVHEGELASVFTKALSDAILQGDRFTLGEVIEQTVDGCSELIAEVKSGLKKQAPVLRGVTRDSTEDRNLRGQKIFDPKILSRVWSRFEPDRMHCLVVTSESDSGQGSESNIKTRLQYWLEDAHGRRIWDAFCGYAHDRLLVGGVRRKLDANFDPEASIRRSVIPVQEAFDERIFEDVVRGLVEADLAVFDVTNFEPGMMLLMGIRGASRRGVSVCTVGGTWQELEALDIPFNLRDLSLGSHSESVQKVERDAVDKRFVQRVTYGFEQLCRQPFYRDLPAYDAVRQLGSGPEAASTIPPSKHVLVLAPYTDVYYDSWKKISSKLSFMLEERGSGGKIVRLVDLGNPQLVSQHLYEQIRRVAGCVVDWTEYSPSTLFELGVRLAVSEYGAVQIVDRKFVDEAYLDDRARPQEEREKREERLAKRERRPKRDVPEMRRWVEMKLQIKRMTALFRPFEYDLDDQIKRRKGLAFREAAKLLVPLKDEAGPAPEDVEPGGEDARATPRFEPGIPPAQVHRIVSDALNEVQEARPAVHEALSEIADSLHHPTQGTTGAAQLPFLGSSDTTRLTLKKEAETAAREARLAAWLYLGNRLKVGGDHEDAQLRKTFERLGTELAAAFFDEDHLDQGKDILDTLRPPPAKLLRKYADCLRRVKREGWEANAKQALERAVEVLEEKRQALPPARDKQTAGPQADTHGAIGGMWRRLGDVKGLKEAARAYSRGAKLEADYGLASTYNRLNAIKLQLQLKSEDGGKTLAELEDNIGELAVAIEDAFRENPALGDSGWAWADLGDCKALLGDPGAEEAYENFVRRAELKSPDIALGVLEGLAKAMEEKDDPGASRLRRAAEKLRNRFEGAKP